jgi:hypothetical protein
MERTKAIPLDLDPRSTILPMVMLVTLPMVMFGRTANGDVGSSGQW